MKKRILGMILAGTVLSVSLTACGNKDAATSSETIENEESEVAENEETSQEPDSEAVETETVAAEDYVEGKAEDFEVTYFDDESVEIIKYLGDAKYLKVPEEINGKKVATICGFIDNDSIVGVKLPESSRIIRNRAFDDCENLVSVEFGNNVESIEEYAFCNCKALVTIKLPDSISEIGEMVFGGSALTEINIPSGLSETKYGSFADNKLVELTVPGNVKVIGNRTFSGDRDLKKAVIEEGVEEIECDAFEDCTSMEELHLPASVTTYGDNYIIDPNDNLTIYAPAGSAAETYANDNNINFVAE